MPGTAIITCLGTATEYTPGPSDAAGYPKGETLSLISACLHGVNSAGDVSPVLQHLATDMVNSWVGLDNSDSDEVSSVASQSSGPSEGSEDSPPASPKLLPATQSVRVIRGPDNVGSEVGDRIASGVFAALEAIARDESQINIIAHSRGGAQAGLLTHELTRMLSLFRQRPLDWDAILNSSCTYTKKAMLAQKAAFKSLDTTSIATNARNVKVALFLIDPVPGGGPIRWHDDRFYKLSPIVKHCEEYVYENERTRGFKPIIPQVMPGSTTQFRVQSIPGHHGTGSGNFKSQQGEAVPEGTHAEDVQKLLLLKLVSFLKAHGASFVRERPAGIDEGIWEWIAPHMHSDESVDDALLECYRGIQNNRPAYEFFNTTHYGMGQEQGIQRLWGDVRDDRIVHYRQRSKTNTFLPEVLPPYVNPRFVNREHALLESKKVVSLSYSGNIAESINQLVEQLVLICSKPLGQLSDSVSQLSQSTLMGELTQAVVRISEQHAHQIANLQEENDAIFAALENGLSRLAAFPSDSLQDGIVAQLSLMAGNLQTNQHVFTTRLEEARVAAEQAAQAAAEEAARIAAAEEAARIAAAEEAARIAAQEAKAQRKADRAARILEEERIAAAKEAARIAAAEETARIAAVEEAARIAAVEEAARIAAAEEAARIAAAEQVARIAAAARIALAVDTRPIVAAQTGPAAAEVPVVVDPDLAPTPTMPSANKTLEILGWCTAAFGLLALVAGIILLCTLTCGVLPALAATAAAVTLAGSSVITAGGGALLTLGLFGACKNLPQPQNDIPVPELVAP